MTTPTRICATFLAAFAATTSIAAAPTLTIKATKKTADTDRSSEQLGNFKTRQDVYKKQYYEVTLSALGVAPTNDIVISWAVILEDEKGRMRLGALGGTQTNFTRARSIEVRTDEFELEEHSISRARGTIGRESEIHAYGIRVTDMQGTVLADKIEPTRATAEINEAFDGKITRGEPDRKR